MARPAEWMRTLAQLKLPRVSPHALRYTHASQLIASGMDVAPAPARVADDRPRRIRPSIQQHRRPGCWRDRESFQEALADENAPENSSGTN